MAGRVLFCLAGVRFCRGFRHGKQCLDTGLKLGTRAGGSGKTVFENPLRWNQTNPRWAYHDVSNFWRDCQRALHRFKQRPFAKDEG